MNPNYDKSWEYLGLLAANSNVDELYSLSEIKSKADIFQRGLVSDLFCHLIANARAYKLGTHNSVNPLDYITYSGHVFELGAVPGLMEILEDTSEEWLAHFGELVFLMDSYTEELMQSVGQGREQNFINENQHRHTQVIELIDCLDKLVDLLQLNPKRIEHITQHILNTNSPKARISRLLKRKP